jgi:ribosomal protein S11
MTTTTKTKTTKRQATRLMKAEQEAIKKGVCFLSAVTNNSYLHITNRTLPKNVFDLEPT